MRDVHFRYLAESGDFVVPTASLKRTFYPHQSPTHVVLPEFPSISSLSSLKIPLSVIPNPACKLQSPSDSTEHCWGYWTVPDPQGGSNPDSRSALFPDHKLIFVEFRDFVVRPKPPELRDIGLQLARPRHAFPNRPLRPPLPPPRSTGYEVFCAQHRSSSEDRQSADISDV